MSEIGAIQSIRHTHKQPQHTFITSIFFLWVEFRHKETVETAGPTVRLSLSRGFHRLITVVPNIIHTTMALRLSIP